MIDNTKIKIAPSIDNAWAHFNQKFSNTTGHSHITIYNS